ncbi:MAG: hypothetical protein ABI818_00800 [Acidobacteriota bacterium]
MAATTATAIAAEPTSITGTPERNAPVVLDLGKQGRKSIKRLRRGEGRLLDDINGAIEELRTVGTIGATTQPVIIVVRQKSRKAKSMFPLL